MTSHVDGWDRPAGALQARSAAAPSGRRRLILFFSLCAYVAVVAFSYDFFMLERWGFHFAETSWGEQKHDPINALICYVLLSFLIVFVSNIGDEPSDFLHVMFFSIPIIPMFILSINKNIGSEYMIYVTACFLISYFCSRILKFEFVPRIKNISMSTNQYINTCILFGIFIIALCVQNNGVSYMNFDFERVYEFRRAASAERGVILNYMVLNYIGILIGLGFALCLRNKRFVSFSILLVINVIIFGFTSNKAFLFVGLFSLAVYVITSFEMRNCFYMICLAVFCFVLVSLYVFNEEFWYLATLFVRRYVFVPSYVSFFYYDFFSTNPFNYWSDSKISLGLVQTIYDRPIPRIILDRYSGIDFSQRLVGYGNANTGWLGSGYGNAGFVGMLVYAVFCGFITRYANLLAEIIGERAALSAVGFFFFAVFFTSTDPPAAMLSYGFIALLLVMSVLRDPRPRPIEGRLVAIAPASPTAPFPARAALRRAMPRHAAPRLGASR